MSKPRLVPESFLKALLQDFVEGGREHSKEDSEIKSRLKGLAEEHDIKDPDALITLAFQDEVRVKVPRRWRLVIELDMPEEFQASGVKYCVEARFVSGDWKNSRAEVLTVDLC